MTDDLTAAEAAEITGKSRRTIGRMLTAGRLPGAERTAQGWRIPRAALDLDPAETSNVTHDTEFENLRAELEEWRRRAEVAEAVAAERAGALNDARASLALAQRLAAVTIAENVTPRTLAVESEPRTATAARRLIPTRWRKNR